MVLWSSSEVCPSSDFFFFQEILILQNNYYFNIQTNEKIYRKLTLETLEHLNWQKVVKGTYVRDLNIKFKDVTPNSLFIILYPVFLILRFNLHCSCFM